MSQILIFAETAKHENFSVAADHLNVTQPMVSRTISQLEKELGFSLFCRKNQKVFLTASGRSLASSWASLIESLEGGIQSAEEISHQLKTVFTICDDRETDKKLYLYPILDCFSKHHPEIMLNIEQTDASWTIDNLYTSNVDVAFLMYHEIDALDPDILDWKVIHEMPWCAFVPKGNRLFTRDSITVQDLNNEPIVALSATASRGYSYVLSKLFSKNNVTPQVISRVSNNASLTFAMHRGDGIVLANELISVPSASNTKMFVLEGTSDSLCIAWRKSQVNETLLDFINTSTDFFSNDYVFTS